MTADLLSFDAARRAAPALRAQDRSARSFASSAGARVRPELAVVIATRGRSALLQRCLDALLRQSLPGACYEILVVDDGPDESTRRAVAEAAARAGGSPAVRYLRRREGHGPAAARNLGWRASAAPLIAFTDDDTVPDPHWLREGQRALEDRPAVAARGQIRVPWSGAPTDHARMTQGLEAAEFVTANAFVRREALARVGGFDERFTRAWREDSDLYFSLLGAGLEVVAAPRAVVLHPVRPAPWGISLRQQANVSFDALLYKKHPLLYRRKIRQRPPWHYLGTVGLSVAALVAAAAGAPVLAAGCGLGAAAFVAAFAAQRLRGASHAPAHVAEMIVTSAAIPFLALFWRAVGIWRFRVLFP